MKSICVFVLSKMKQKPEHGCKSKRICCLQSLFQVLNEKTRKQVERERLQNAKGIAGGAERLRSW